MNNIYDKVANYIKSENIKKQILLKNKEYLIPGKYVFNNTGKFAYLQNLNVEEKAKLLFQDDPLNKFSNSNSNIILKFIRTNLSNNIKLNSKVCEFDGAIYFFTTNHNKDRIFDFNNLKVKILFSNSDMKENYVNTYNKFSPFFNQPKILDEDLNTITEELVLFDDGWELNLPIISNIFNNYIQYYCKVAEKSTRKFRIKEMLEEFRLEEVTFFFKNNIDKRLLNDEMISVECHGDLRRNNILYNSKINKFHYIDWEFSDYYSLTYDLFFLMYHEAVFNNNYTLIRKYMNGEFDNKLTTIFGIFGKEFENNLRESYLYAFMLEHYIKKVKFKLPIVNNYKKLLNNI